MRALRVTAVLALGGVVTAAATELAVRRWAPQELTSEIWTFDGPICHQLKPLTEGRQQSPEFEVKLSISEQGLRDRFYPPKDERTKRILLLGDSHTFGFGVELADTYVKTLERRLNEHLTAGRYEVLNAGTIGYGTGHQYQHLEYHGYALEPDLVIVAMNFLHDVEINNDQFAIEGDSLIRTATPCKPQRSYARTRFIPFISVLRGHSHAFRYAGLVARGRPATTRDEALASVDQGPRPERFRLANTKRIFELMQRDLADRGIDFAVVILSVDPLRAVPTAPGQLESRRLEREALDAFQVFLRERGIAFLSFPDRFELAPPPVGIAFDHSFHYNAAGHRMLAREIERFLMEAGRVADR